MTENTSTETSTVAHAVPLPRQVSGDAIRREVLRLPAAGATSRTELAERTGLTISQVDHGLAWIREIGAIAHASPFTYSRKDGYQFSDDPQVWIDCLLAGLDGDLTRFDRELKGIIIPFLQRMPEDPRPKYFKAQVEAMISSVEMMRTEIPARAATQTRSSKKGRTTTHR